MARRWVFSLQRSGRIIRQGNENPKVDIFRYVTEETFDAYLYQLVEGKQKFISQIMTSKSPVRSAEDIDEASLSYAEIKMLATGNPHIKEKMDLDIQVSKLKMLKQSHLSERYSLEDKVLKHYPEQIKSLEQQIKGFGVDIKTVSENTILNDEKFSVMEVKGTIYNKKAEAGEAIIAACKSMTNPNLTAIGEYRGFKMGIEFDTFSKEYNMILKGELSHKVPLGSDVYGNIVRIDNALENIENKKTFATERLEENLIQLENAKVEIERPFPQEELLTEKSTRLDELNILLNMDKKENEVLDGDISEDEIKESSKDKDNVR